MTKKLDRLRSFFKKIKHAYKEFEVYDRVYFNGKLSSALIFLICILIIGCFVLAFIVFD